MNSLRRRWIMWVPALVTAPHLSLLHAAPAAVLETDPDARAVGYVTDAKRVDAARYPLYSAPQQCANCQLFSAQADGGPGLCTLFKGRTVTPNGWCKAYQAAI